MTVASRVACIVRAEFLPPNGPTNQLISLMQRFLLRPSADAQSTFFYGIDHLPIMSENLDLIRSGFDQTLTNWAGYDPLLPFKIGL